MRYETTQKYYVELYQKYLTKHGIIYVRQTYQNYSDQQNLIDLRLIAANGGVFAHPYTQIVDGESVSGLPYFSIEKRDVDINSSHNREALLADYREYESLNELLYQDDPSKMLSFHGYLNKHSQIDVGILTKRVENQNTLVTLLNPAYFPAKFGISVVNVFEEFDFKALQVNLKVVLETKSKLTTNELLELSEKIDGQMSDGWGEEYDIEEVNEFHDVNGWQYGNKPDNPLVESTHNLYYPEDKN
jgi:hypothetical protein